MPFRSWRSAELDEFTYRNRFAKALVRKVSRYMGSAQSLRVYRLNGTNIGAEELVWKSRPRVGISARGRGTGISSPRRGALARPPMERLSIPSFLPKISGA